MTCSLCGNDAFTPGCHACGWRQPTLFPVAEPPAPDPRKLAVARRGERARFLEIAQARGRPAALASLRRPLRVALLAASRHQLAEPAPARTFYRSAFFQSALAAANTMSDETYVLSISAGLVGLDETVTPPDPVIQDVPRRRRKEWPERIGADVRRRLGDLDVEFTVLAGHAWWTPISGEFCRRRWTVHDLFPGMTLGGQHRWIREQISTSRRVWRGVLP